MCFQIGVATSKTQPGRSKHKPHPMTGSFSIDPAVFVDDDGSAYMYFVESGRPACNAGKTGSMMPTAPKPICIKIT